MFFHHLSAAAWTDAAWASLRGGQLVGGSVRPATARTHDDCAGDSPPPSGGGGADGGEAAKSTASAGSMRTGGGSASSLYSSGWSYGEVRDAVMECARDGVRHRHDKLL